MTKEEKFEMVKKLEKETGHDFDGCGYVLNITEWNYEEAVKVIDFIYMTNMNEPVFIYEFLKLKERVESLEKIVKEKTHD